MLKFDIFKIVNFEGKISSETAELSTFSVQKIVRVLTHQVNKIICFIFVLFKNRNILLLNLPSISINFSSTCSSAKRIMAEEKEVQVQIMINPTKLPCANKLILLEHE